MTPEQYERMWHLFDGARGRGPAERAAFLDEHCAGSRELRTQVDRLLEAEPASFLLEPCPVWEPATLVDPLLGRRVGPYQVVRPLGKGGMGDVYLAVRREDYSLEVAVKVIRPGWGDADILRRFQTERQVLADLVHPHIARLLDGGTTEDGRPYFVMEYIDGRPVNDYCAAHDLPVRARLELFCQVCRAVHFAHQKRVLHRDVKPDNILVGADGAPKLLDFGIAKVLDTAAGRPGNRTRTGCQPATPVYASPEQLRGVAELTFASDVYSLGVVLYELLAGCRPHQVPGEDVDEVGLRLRGQEPNPPRRWRPDLPAELERVCLTCLESDPRRRYPSAEALAEDLRRFLAGEPLRQPGPGRRERLRRWCRRHPALLGGLAVAAVLAAACALWPLLRRAEAPWYRDLPPEAFQTATPQHPVFRAVHSDDPAALAYLQAHHGADLTVRLPTGNTPLHEAALYGRAKAARFLIEQGADLEARNDRKETPLHRAAVKGRLEVVGALIDAGADREVRDDLEETPLACAVRAGQAEAARCLVNRYKADPNARDFSGQTPLHRAVEGGRLELVEFLLASGAVIGAADDNLETPLHAAARHGSPELVAYLLRNGADPRAVNRDEETPLRLAELRRHREAATLLRGKTAKPDSE
jgi:ankyrin repeat protein